MAHSLPLQLTPTAGGFHVEYSVQSPPRVAGGPRLHAFTAETLFHWSTSAMSLLRDGEPSRRLQVTVYN